MNARLLDALLIAVQMIIGLGCIGKAIAAPGFDVIWWCCGWIVLAFAGSDWLALRRG